MPRQEIAIQDQLEDTNTTACIRRDNRSCLAIQMVMKYEDPHRLGLNSFTMNYYFFLLLNAVLLLRPEELFPEIAGLRLYLIVIAACCVLSLPELSRVLAPDSLRTNPVTVCVLLYYFANIVSLCLLGRLDEAITQFGPEFGKVIVYFLLFQAVVNTPERFRGIAVMLVALVIGLVCIALAQHHGYVHFDTIIPCLQNEINPDTRESYQMPRLVSTGIFNDPNDLCLILGVGILSCVYCATTARDWAMWALWLSPIPLFVHALMETHSRGGMLGVLGGVAAYIYSRFGGPKALPMMIGAVAIALVAVGGRQGNITGGGTAHARLMMWAEGLTSLFSQPFYIFTGLGQRWYIEEVGLVAHNSFIQAFVESGLLGGACFLSAYYLGIRILDRIGRGVPAAPWAINARHYGFAVLSGYAIGCYSLTRNFVVPTYIPLALTVVLCRSMPNQFPHRFQISLRWFGWLGLLGVCGLLALKLATQTMGQLGI